MNEIGFISAKVDELCIYLEGCRLSITHGTVKDITASGEGNFKISGNWILHDGKAADHQNNQGKDKHSSGNSRVNRDSAGALASGDGAIAVGAGGVFIAGDNHCSINTSVINTGGRCFVGGRVTTGRNQNVVDGFSSEVPAEEDLSQLKDELQIVVPVDFSGKLHLNCRGSVVTIDHWRQGSVEIKATGTNRLTCQEDLSGLESISVTFEHGDLNLRTVESAVFQTVISGQAKTKIGRMDATVCSITNCGNLEIVSGMARTGTLVNTGTAKISASFKSLSTINTGILLNQ